jgi:hypothetical protein
MQRIGLAALLACLALAPPAMAQNTGISGGGYGGFGSVGGGADYGGPPARRRLAVPPVHAGRPGGAICVTSRGRCAVRPAPRGARCGCEIPGRGFRRGVVR